MQRFKLGFRNKSALEQLLICQRTVASLESKPELVFDPAQVADARVAVDAVRDSHERIGQLRSQLKAEVTNRNALLRTARQKVTNVCLGVEVKVAFDPSQMSAAGLDLEASKTAPVGKPSAPALLRAVPTANEGEVRLTWRRPLRRCTFSIEYRADTAAADAWTRTDISLRQSCVVRELVSGEKYWFRVSAANAHGEGPWSNAVPARVK